MEDNEKCDCLSCNSDRQRIPKLDMEKREKIMRWWYGPMYTPNMPIESHIIELFKIIEI